MENSHFRVAVIGAGWAGSVAAAMLAEAGADTTVFEAAPIAGGRARRVEKDARTFDNGQHLLLGAYRRTLSWIDRLVSPGAYHRQPLEVASAPATTPAFRMRAPAHVPAPLHLAWALLNADGPSLSDRLATLTRFGRLLRRISPTDQTVGDWLADIPASMRRLALDPLCTGALNTPPERASARVFAAVLRRAFFDDAHDADFVIPARDLSALLPEAALAEVIRRGGRVRLATPVLSIQRAPEGGIAIETRAGRETFSAVLIAAAPQHVPRLLAPLEDEPSLAQIRENLAGLAFEAIATVHLDLPFFGGLHPERNRIHLLDGRPGQWLFLHTLPQGQLRASVVLSALDDTLLMAGGEAISASVRQQLGRNWQLPEPLWQQCIIEKRATYACTPRQHALLYGLTPLLCPTPERPVAFAGDWTEPSLPATLEAAVLSGERAARQLLDCLPR
ncbi:MAG: hydroxysqualene dehydroxylase HpnE [Casimicrobiaceae bacterium]